MSKIIVIGNVTRDGEVGKTRNGTEYLRTGFAENISDGQTVFFDLTLYRPSDYAKRTFIKGARMHIIGGFDDYIYGERKLLRNITVDSYQCLERPKEGSDRAENIIR